MIARKEFTELLRKKNLLLDGSYGTSFSRMGFADVPSEKLNLTHPDRVEALQRSYVEAGSDILMTNTFCGNRYMLEQNGLADDMHAIHFQAVEIACRAAKVTDRQVLVFGDISSTERPLGGDVSFEDWQRCFKEQANLLLEAGCDGLIVETIVDLEELRAALSGVREASSETPLIAQMAVGENGLTSMGATLQDFADVVNALDVDVAGMNCEVGPAGMLANVKQFASLTNCFLSIEPNAEGEGATTPSDFARSAADFVAAGVSIFGGCCGTDAAHIKALAEALRDLEPAGKRRVR